MYRLISKTLMIQIPLFSIFICKGGACGCFGGGGGGEWMVIVGEWVDGWMGESGVVGGGEVTQVSIHQGG